MLADSTPSLGMSATMSAGERPDGARLENASLEIALNVIATERDALTNLEMLYRTNSLAQEGIGHAVTQLVKTIKRGGKLVVCGVGKSGKIGRKLEATMNSMGIHSVFLHPTEALHGDLGIIREIDTLLLISFSGRTPELLLMLPHIPQAVPVIAITSHTHRATCPLLSYHPPDMTILLPAPTHIDEETSFGVCAPTSSTTVALALGDALALATAQSLHNIPGQGPAEVFKAFHPGGAIGATAAASAISTPKSTSTSTSTSMTSLSLSSLDDVLPRTSNNTKPNTARTMADLIVPCESIPTVRAGDIRVLDVLLAAIQNPTARSWVKISPTEIIPPHRLRTLAQEAGGDNVDAKLSDVSPPVSAKGDLWLRLPASTSIEEGRRWVSEYDALNRGSDIPLVISVVDDRDENRCLGFVCAREGPFRTFNLI